MKLSLVLIFTALVHNAYSWGPLGHRITAKIAEEHLSTKAKMELKKLFPKETLSKMSNYPDFIKSDPELRKKYNHFHYISFDEKKSVKDYIADNSKKENVIFGINHFAKIFKDKKSTPKDKLFALQFIVHLVGDIHQPLHAGKASDRGANKIQVTWFGKKTNLHAVWDESLIEMQKLSYTEYADELMQTLVVDKELLKKMNPEIWAQESKDYVEKVYSFKKKKYWEYDYNYQHIAFLNQRLLTGGLRLALFINQLF